MGGLYDYNYVTFLCALQGLPPRKDFIRGVSYMTGFVIRANGPGCKLIYITQNDPKGEIIVKPISVYIIVIGV